MTWLQRAKVAAIVVAMVAASWGVVEIGRALGWVSSGY